jgi:hypothetical protein
MMSHPNNSHKCIFSTLLQISRPALLLTICLSLTLILSGCSSCWSRSNAKDDAILAAEHQRLEAEKRAEREAAIRELLARNIPSDTDSNKHWEGFRKAYSYHSQTLAMSSASADGSRTLIISEPPPQLTAGDILLPLGNVLRNHSEKKQKIGYDGWVKDLVVEIAGDQSAVDSAVSSVNRLIFGTSYKSYVLPLPLKAPGNSPFDLDLQVTTAELKQWALDENETFTPIEGGESLPFPKLFEQTISGVFYSDHGGLVAWFIPKGRTIDDCRVQARQFSLDSDLIVGAFSDHQGILILGRDRLIPVDILPPLRVETLSLLGAVQKGQSGKLAQSYERNHLFAGRFEGRKDWAPILLSPELRDTEYGSLLNITDQLLKGWSNNGDTSYHNFNYPRPNRWPFKGSLIRQLDTTELTYNWNTRGAGYTVDVGGYSVLALNRTGALPVSYFPIEAGAEGTPATLAAEDEAYTYFAKLNDPNLVRVVQYAAMYQIFSAFDIAIPGTQPPTNTLPDTKLDQMTDDVLSEIRNSSSEELEALAHQLLPGVSAQLNGKDFVQQLVAEVMTKRAEEISKNLQENGYVKGTSEYDDSFRDAMAVERENVLWRINQALAEQKKQLPTEIRNELKSVAAGLAADPETEQVRKSVLSQLAGLRKFPARYATAVDTQSAGWIHTPAVVISWNMGELLGGVGGHNLDAKVTKFRISNEVPQGTTRVDGEGNILVNSRDFARVNKVVRAAGRVQDQSPYAISSELNTALTQVAETAPRPRQLALNLATSSPPLPPNGPPRPPLSFATPGPEFGGEPWRGGWARPRAQVSEPLQAVLSQRRADSPGVILIDRDSTGLISIAHSERSPAIRATNPEDAVDVVVQLMRKSPQETQALNIEFRGFPEQDARSFIKSCEVRASSEKIPREISGVVDEAAGGGNGGTGGPRDPNRLPGPDENGPRRSGPGNGKGENFGGADRESLLLAIKNRRYDFSSAEVKVNPEIVVQNNIQRSSISVEIPAADAGAPGRSTIELGFRKSTPREAVTAATHRVADSVRTFIRGIRNELQALSFNLRLNSEVKRVSREMDIDINLIRHSFDTGKGDLYFARREDMDEPPSRDTAAS